MAVNFSAAVKAPPTRTNRASGRAQSVEPPKPKLTVRELREDGLIGIGQLGQAVAIGLRQYADGATIGMHFPPIAKELATLADQYEVLAKPIDLIIQVGPFGALLAATLPFVAQLAVNHRMAPAGVMNTVPPETLSAQMQAQMMRLQAEALRQQQLAQKEMQAAEAELRSMMNGSAANDSPSVQG